MEPAFLGLFHLLQLSGTEGGPWMFAAVSLPGTERCLQFAVALLRQYETHCSSFGPEWVCRWETSLDDWLVLP